MKVPESFHWVIAQMLKWQKEQKTGKFVLHYKEGGISGVERRDYERPPK